MQGKITAVMHLMSILSNFQTTLIIQITRQLEQSDLLGTLGGLCLGQGPMIHCTQPAVFRFSR